MSAEALCACDWGRLGGAMWFGCMGRVVSLPAASRRIGSAAAQLSQSTRPVLVGLSELDHARNGCGTGKSSE